VYGRKTHINSGWPKEVATFPRQALHAITLTFEHPQTHEQLRFEVPLPKDMLALMDSLGRLE
jgi:23S rRNA pseudouridine1911/1915/1917 synthase